MFSSNFWNGVDLFFVLSRYLIGGILIRNKGSNNYFKTFYIRRIFRIFPIYYLILGVYIILIIAIPNLDKLIPILFSNPIPVWSFIIYCQNYLMITFNTFGASWLGVTWSLAIEEQFYLLLPLLVFIFNRKILTILIIILIFTAVIFRYYSSDNLMLKHISFQCRMDSLFTGVAIAIFMMNQNFVNFLKSQKTVMYIVFLTLIGIFFFISFTTGTNNSFLIYSGFNILFAMFIIIALLFKEGFITRFLENKWLCKIGTVSYGIYLFHMIVLYLVYWVLEKAGIYVYSNWLLMIVISCAFLLTYIISRSSYKFYESALIKFSRKYKY